MAPMMKSHAGQTLNSSFVKETSAKDHSFQWNFLKMPHCCNIFRGQTAVRLQSDSDCSLSSDCSLGFPNPTRPELQSDPTRLHL